jgi:ribosomal protein S18 acetylase RimI-like enzyme
MPVDSMPITLRPVLPDDEPFLLEMYAGTRPDVAEWGWDAAQQEAFLRMQFDLQQRAWAMQSPEAKHQIILLGDRQIGRIITLRTDQQIRLSDIALLPQHRNNGIGASLIKDLCAEAAQSGLPVQLQVLKSNPALRLYERLGFLRIGESSTHFQMEWRADRQL